PRAEASLDVLVSLAEPLAAGRPAREVIIAILTHAEELGRATALANGRRTALARRGVAARAAAVTSASRGDDLVRLAAGRALGPLAGVRGPPRAPPPGGLWRGP